MNLRTVVFTMVCIAFALTLSPCVSAQAVSDHVRLAPWAAESITKKVVLPRDIGIPGEVTLRVEVGKNGKVLSMRGVSGDSRLIRAATPSMMDWIFAPYLLNGEPVKFVTDVTIQFDGKTQLAKLKVHKHSPANQPN